MRRLRYHVRDEGMEGQRAVTETVPIEQVCMDCGQAFLVPPAEQQFRREHGLKTADACPDCRAKLRAARNGDLIALYERLGQSSDLEPSTPGRRSTSGRAAGPRQGAGRQLFAAVCAACGAETRVPFVPRRDRPVYCRDCYNARQGR